MLTITPYKLSEMNDITKLMFALNSEDTDELPLTQEKVDAFFNFVKTSSSTKLFSLKNDDALIGYCSINIFFSNEFGGECLEIDELYIASDFRNKGIGTKVMEYFEEYAKIHKIFTLFLIATDSNTRAQRFYERFGFKKLPRVEYIKELKR